MATLNGNGNGRAVLPPPVLDPMRRYRQPPPPPRSTGRLIGKIFGWIMLALLVVGSGLAGGLYLYGHETLSALGPHTAAVKRAQKDLQVVPPPSQAATALIVGYDQRAGADGFGAKQSRSDTLMLVRADPQQDTLSLLSFPRDLNVTIHCPNQAPVIDRINAAWTDCGAQGTLDTVQQLTGIPVNYLITLDFHGFKLMVNKLHGVYMNVDQRYYIPPNTGVAAINLQPGYQKLDGGDALNFVRFRETDNDLYRNARQQLFLEAFKDRLKSSLSLFQIPQLIGAVKKSVEIARGGSTGTPSMSEIQSYIGLGENLKPGHMFRVSINNLYPCGIANAQLCGATSDIQAAVDSFMHPDVTVANRANDAALGIKRKTHKQTTIKPARITTLVLNGTTIGGLARDTSFKLAQAGFHTVQLPPDDSRRHADGDLHLELRVLRFCPAEREGGRTAAEGGDGPEHVARPVAAGDRPVRTAGGQSARGGRRRHRVQRRARQSGRAHRSGAAAPAPERPQRPRSDARLGRGGAEEGAVPDHGSDRARAELVPHHARAGAGVQAGTAHARARADVRDRSRQRATGT